ncbi:Choline-sulfatase [Arthrobacter rhombi]|uniref:Choline-sulfatase n=2 Tax=Arthrobacter rhombi TaxID=71253 RepID=A0A1R4FH24_9MICC|nr:MULTISPECIES: choline-sulfatase [Micrococcaceae]PCC26495.1 choline-sulfatase [Glutamicibacter sp. BW78]SJM55169.1 Choline-sulfatase [Arthrobacter rhombi]
MRPNIVVIQADQMAAQALGAYGDAAAKTPNIDRLAAESAVFDRAYCNTPLCAPSRASMMTGEMPSDLGCYDNGDDFPASTPTFAHHLRNAGYHTALVGRMHFIGPDQHHGFEQRLTTDVYPADMDMVPDWQRDPSDRLQWYHDADAVFTAGVSKATVQQDFDDEVAFRTLRHLNDRVRANQAASEDTPFLMVTSFIHPHDPYEPPRDHWDRFADDEIPDPKYPQVPSLAEDPHSHRLRAMSGFDQRDPSLEEVRRARRSYYAAVSYIDDHVGRIRERLEELDLLENTVIIVTSDHGDMLGEKGLWYKMSPYEESSRVPLIVYGPEHLVPQGRYANPVSLLDLMPTLLELAGAPGGEPKHDIEQEGSDAASGSARRGVSLLESARREADGRAGPEDRDVVIEYLAEGTLRPQLTLVRGQYKYIVCPGDPEQLFDLRVDPHELENVVSKPMHAELVELLRKELATHYDLVKLERDVLESQVRRRLVAGALQRGKTRHWDLVPEPEQRYVRGDFWGALEFGQIRDTSH